MSAEALDFPPLEPCEALLADAAEDWYRQVHRRYIDGCRVGELAFRPTDRDQGKLSGTRSSKQTARGAYEESMVASDGTWRVPVGAVSEIGLRCVDDSGCRSDDPQPVGHTYVDFRPLGKKQERIKRLEMAQMANDNGNLPC